MHVKTQNCREQFAQLRMGMCRAVCDPTVLERCVWLKECSFGRHQQFKVCSVLVATVVQLRCTASLLLCIPLDMAVALWNWLADALGAEYPEEGWGLVKCVGQTGAKFWFVDLQTDCSEPQWRRTSWSTPHRPKRLDGSELWPGR